MSAPRQHGAPDTSSPATTTRPLSAAAEQLAAARTRFGRAEALLRSHGTAPPHA